MTLVLSPADFAEAEKFRRGHGGKYDRDVAMLTAAFARRAAAARLAALEEAAKVAEAAVRMRVSYAYGREVLNPEVEALATAIRSLSKTGEGVEKVAAAETLGQYAALRSAQHALDIIARKIGARTEISELAIEESNRIEQAIIALDGCWPFAASNKGGRDGE